MKLVMLEGTPDEIKEVAHLFVDTATAGSGQAGAAGDPWDAGMDPVKAIRRMLKRIKISEGQMAVYEALANGRLKYSEYLARTGRTVEQIRGVHGALGRRINSTPEIHQAGLPGNSKAVLVWDGEGEDWYLSLTPHALEALIIEGVV